ncbi:hypothetical protein AB0H73_35005 [Streptomyces olivoreticuli]
MPASTTRVHLTGVAPPWPHRPIAASKSTDAWSDTVRHAINGTAPWVLIVTAGAVAVVMLLMVYLVVRGLWRYQASRRQIRVEELARVREEQGDGAALGLTGMGRAGWVALSGTLVSQYGLWEFGRDTAHLPLLIRIGFVIMFDLLELQLFSLLYRNANPDEGWTRSLRLTHGTAWGLVVASSIANFSHAPNLASAPFMAMMPPATAWVIELELRKRMADAEKSTREQAHGNTAGPVRLVALLWRKLWVGTFSVLTLDPNTGGADGVVGRALTRKAAKESHRLRQLLLEEDELKVKLGELEKAGPGRSGERQLRDVRAQLAAASKKAEKQRARSQRSLDRANFDEPEQQLQVMRRKAALTHTDAVARLEHESGTEAIELLEKINVVASADLIAASARAAEVEQQAAQVEERRRKAQAALDDAQERLAEVEQSSAERLAEAEGAVEQAAEALRKTAADHEWELERLGQLRDEYRRLEESGASGHQLYQVAEARAARLERRQEEELGERARLLTMLEEERGRLTDAADLAREEAKGAREKLLVLEGEYRGLRERLEELQRREIETREPRNDGEPRSVVRGATRDRRPGRENGRAAARRSDGTGNNAKQGTEVKPEQEPQQGTTGRPLPGDDRGAVEPADRELGEQGVRSDELVVASGDQEQDGEHARVLARMTNADAVRHAMQVLGTFESGELVDWLEEHGKKVNRGQAYKIAFKAAQKKAAEEAGAEERDRQQQAVA